MKNNVWNYSSKERNLLVDLLILIFLFCMLLFLLCTFLPTKLCIIHIRIMILFHSVYSLLWLGHLCAQVELHEDRFNAKSFQFFFLLPVMHFHLTSLIEDRWSISYESTTIQWLVKCCFRLYLFNTQKKNWRKMHSSVYTYLLTVCQLNYPHLV